MFKKYIFPQLSALLFTFSYLHAATPDTRSDSFNISHYSITLDLSNLSSQALSGHCELKGISVIDKLDRLSLELYKLKVDSVTQNGKSIVFQYNDSLLTPHFGKQINTNDSFDIIVYYHGKPVKTSWGGFTFDGTGQFAYNLGIGLYAIPHNFGRVWFPCVDNFIDKATFSFFIKSKNSHKVYCNGLLIDSTFNADNTLTWHWEMKQNIPPYLASVAVGSYKTLYSSFNSLTGKKPILMGVLTGDTVIAKTCFQHLPKVLANYEGYYGPYMFDKVGFVGVNFGSGAMEHASNIALPNTAIEAGLSEESLWAHELSHHWFGDLVTCQTAQDMWLNEGWASFNESMYQEKIYGTKAYNDNARSTHFISLAYAPVTDNGFLALSPMDNENTYGATVYDKGADVARTLRGYMGDSLFFQGLKQYMHDYAFKSATSEDFKNSLSKSSGVDLTGFFNDWVYSPGWPHYEIQSYIYKNDQQGMKQYQVNIKRRALNSTGLFKSIPMALTYFDASWNAHTFNLVIDSISQTFTIPFPQYLNFLALDISGKITDATTKQYLVIKKTGNYAFNESLMSLTVDSIKDSAFIYLVHNWVSPERTNNTPKNVRLSSDRYWTIDGIMPKGFHTSATVNYDGRSVSFQKGSFPGGGYLDNDFLKNVPEDSIVLMYRNSLNDSTNSTMGNWMLLNSGKDYIKTMGSTTDEYGHIKILNLKKGQYCFGIYDKNADIKQILPDNNGFDLFPNPTANSLHIKFKDPQFVNSLQVFDTNGKKVKNYMNPSPASNDFTIPNLNLAMGTYILEVSTNEGISCKKFVVEQ